ncbi:hypothetical protein OIU78_025865 [Salix suchowensis]|nr:hypothetical protein OIU78_025865 [Salix suchowensis]
MVLVPAQNISNPSVHSESSCQTQSSSDNTLAPDSNVSSTVVSASGIASQNLMAGVESDSKQAVDTAMKQTASSFEDFWMDYVGTETSSDEHDLTSENIDLEAGQQCGDKFVIPNDGLMEACQGPSIDREPNQKPDSSSVNPWEEEVPLQVQSSEVLLLPYREEGFTDGEIMKGEAESSSSFVGCEQDEAGFDGIGDLFNEPENFSPMTMLGNVRTAQKILGQQRLDAKKKQAKISSNFLLNGGETQIQSESESLDKDISYATEVLNFQNGDGNPNKLLSSTPEVFVSGKDSSNKKFIQAEIVQTEMEPFISPSEEREYEMNVSHSSGYYESCNGETLSGPPADSCSVDETSDTGYTMAKDEQIDSNFSGNCESDVNEDEDKTSKHVNVKRDATKRVLIDKAPPILTIHLKRFSQDARGRLCKLNGHVTFRDVLDVGPYMDPRCVDTESYVYRLLGVVEHLGTMRGGHYIAYVRGDKRNQGKGDEEHGGSVWYYASDAHVREVSLEEVLRCDAYLLFYEKV